MCGRYLRSSIGWSTALTNHFNWLINNEEGYLSKNHLHYYDISLSRAQYLKIPSCIEFFAQYRIFLEYSCTLFHVKKREFFGRSFYTVQENLWELDCRNEGTYLHASKRERIFFHLYDSDVDDVILVIEAVLKWEKTNPQKFSVGFFMIDLVNKDNKAFMAKESPRVLMEEIGENLLRFKTLDGKLRDKAKHAMVHMSETELIYTIDTVPSMMNIGKIVGPNTIYWLREIMPFVNINPTKNDIKELTLEDEEKKEETKGNPDEKIEENKGQISEETDRFKNKDEIADREFQWKWERIVNGLRDQDFFPFQKIIFSNIEILVHQNLQKRVEEIELIEYLFNSKKMNSKGKFIDDFKNSENV